MSLPTATDDSDALLFSARPGENLRAFILALYNSGVAHPDTETAQQDRENILSASAFLAGDALVWFHALLRRNAEVWIEANELYHEEELVLDEGDPGSLYEYGFVLRELRTWDGFVRALSRECIERERERRARASSSPGRTQN